MQCREVIERLHLSNKDNQDKLIRLIHEIKRLIQRQSLQPYDDQNDLTKSRHGQQNPNRASVQSKCLDRNS